MLLSACSTQRLPEQEAVSARPTLEGGAGP